MIKAVLFDYGGVLSESGRVGTVEHILAEIYGIDETDIKLDEIHDRLRRGTITSRKFFTQINRKHPGSAKATKRAFIIHGKELFAGSKKVYSLASKLRDHGFKTGILSNIYEMTADALRKYGRYDGFDPVVLSCEEHLAKPEIAFYERAVKRLGVKPDEIIFVDDQDKCRPPAEALGMHFVLAHNPDQIVTDVKKLILEQNGQKL
ncbi:MAG TPA: HAD family phosphatase [Patescibacteria group bacterium]|nr:HAD family phosphatase [Patescibacteria group bacterium]